jgi:putative FmdB family regulatory protein
MPIYDYRCSECGTMFDVFHKVREVAGDVVCPSCQSTKAKRLISVTSVAVAGSSSVDAHCDNPSSGSCCGGGMCGMN